MSELNENGFEQNEGFFINFNQDYTSLAVVSETGYRLFALSSVNKVDEVFSSNNENTKIAERLFSSSLVAVVTAAEPTKLKVCHFKKGTEICNYNYPSDILSVRLNRSRMIVCLDGSIYIHNIRDMKLLNSIRHIAVNTNGLCSLSLSSHLAFPISVTSGELQIYDALSLKMKMKFKAHESPLSALSFSPNGVLLATASEKGTVIRVFCVKNGQRVHEFRRGVKRYVRIASVNFSNCASFVCVSSNTETVHIFKIDPKVVETVERQNSITSNSNNSVTCVVATVNNANTATVANTTTTTTSTTSTITETNQNKKTTSSSSSSSAELTDTNKDNGSSSGGSRWTMGYITKAVTSYFPSHVSDVLSQDRAFATVQLSQSGMRHQCVIAKLEKETKLIAACEDGFLYIYDFDDTKGGECKLLRVHDLRNALCGVTEIKIDATNLSTMIAAANASSSTSSGGGGGGGGSSVISDGSSSNGSYAAILRGHEKTRMTESEKCRDLMEAVDYPPKSIFDEVQFPPVAVRCD